MTQPFREKLLSLGGLLSLTISLYFCDKSDDNDKAGCKLVVTYLR